MKKYAKYLVMVLMIFMCFGCATIKNQDINTLANRVLNSRLKIQNHVNKGYKYYMPEDLSSSKKDDFNEIIKSKYADYYLYVDLIRYYNDIKIEYKTDDTAYYSQLLEHNGVTGVINVYEKEDSYLVHVMYNYAKVEVVIKKERLNDAIVDSLIITSSIKYNKDIIKDIITKDILNSKDEIINIFEKDDSDDRLKVDDSDEYEEEYDPDVIN